MKGKPALWHRITVAIQHYTRNLMRLYVIKNIKLKDSVRNSNVHGNPMADFDFDKRSASFFLYKKTKEAGAFFFLVIQRPKKHNYRSQSIKAEQIF